MSTCEVGATGGWSGFGRADMVRGWGAGMVGVSFDGRATTPGPAIHVSGCRAAFAILLISEADSCPGPALQPGFNPFAGDDHHGVGLGFDFQFRSHHNQYRFYGDRVPGSLSQDACYSLCLCLRLPEVVGLVPVHQQGSFSDPNPPTEVLCVKREHPARPDHKMVEVGAILAEGKIVKSRPGRRKSAQSASDLLLAYSSLSPSSLIRLDTEKSSKCQTDRLVTSKLLRHSPCALARLVGAHFEHLRDPGWGSRFRLSVIHPVDVGDSR